MQNQRSGRPDIRAEIVKYKETWRTAFYVSWYGESNLLGSTGKRFDFEIIPEKELEHQQRDISSYHVAFLGKASDWPHRERSQAIAELVTHGKVDECLLWLISAKHAYYQIGKGWMPASFMVPVVVKQDPNLGLLTPEVFIDPETWIKEMSEVRRKYDREAKPHQSDPALHDLQLNIFACP